MTDQTTPLLRDLPAGIGNMDEFPPVGDYGEATL